MTASLPPSLPPSAHVAEASRREQHQICVAQEAAHALGQRRGRRSGVCSPRLRPRALACTHGAKLCARGEGDCGEAQRGHTP
eukprot:scaffold103804_cov27-Tisochrysis_lutea.AAC.1